MGDVVDGHEREPSMNPNLLWTFKAIFIKGLEMNLVPGLLEGWIVQGENKLG